MTAQGLSHDRYAEFFEKLVATPHSLLHDVSATIRIDIEENGQAQHWHVTVDHGRITVTQRKAPADATMRTDPALFDHIITGEANALTAALRGRLQIAGDARMLVTFKRLLPGPPKRTTTVPENPPTQARTDTEENV